MKKMYPSKLLPRRYLIFFLKNPLLAQRTNKGQLNLIDDFPFANRSQYLVPKAGKS